MIGPKRGGHPTIVFAYVIQNHQNSSNTHGYRYFGFMLVYDERELTVLRRQSGSSRVDETGLKTSFYAQDIERRNWNIQAF